MATKLGIIGTNVMRAHTRCAVRADVVATKLGIIFLFFLFFFFFLSNLRAAKGPEQSGGTQPSDLDFWLALAGGVRALWVSDTPLSEHIFYFILDQQTYKLNTNTQIERQTHTQDEIVFSVLNFCC